jgi:hypothetical protein
VGGGSKTPKTHNPEKPTNRQQTDETDETDKKQPDSYRSWKLPVLLDFFLCLTSSQFFSSLGNDDEQIAYPNPQGVNFLAPAVRFFCRLNPSFG